MIKKMLLIAVIMSACILFSCGENQTGNNENNLQNNDFENETLPEITGEPVKMLPDLPDINFEGYDFKIYSAGPPRNEWASQDIFAEEETGEPINDAVDRRNRYVEEKYNCRIVDIPSAEWDMTGAIRRAVTAGDDAYDAVVPSMADQANLASAGYFTDLKQVPHLDLAKPWWDQRATVDLTIGNRLFFTVGDFFIMDNDATWLVIFNKKLIADLALENPYDIVKNDKWTFDKLLEMSRGVSQDLNGDGVMDMHDFYGNVSQGENMTAFYLAAGERYVRKNSDDLPFTQMDTDRSTAVIEKIYDLMYDNEISFNYWDLTPSDHTVTQRIFEEDRAVFKITALQLVIRMRNMETNFGIIPMPKFDANQQSYYHYVHPIASALSIPVTAADLSRTGIILEALAAESLYTVRPAYYDISIEGKFLRDEESVEMLDIILATRVFDLGKAFNWSNVGMILEDMYRPKQRDFISRYERQKDRIEIAISRTIEELENSD